MTADQQTLDSFNSEEKGEEEDTTSDEETHNNAHSEEETNTVDMMGLSRVEKTPLAFFAALGVLRLLSKQYDSRVKLRWEKSGYSHVPQIKVEEKKRLTQEEVIEAVKRELYRPDSGTKLLYEETAGRIDWDEHDKCSLLNGNGNSNIVIEKSDDNEGPEIDVYSLLENQDEELMWVLSGFCAVVPGDDDNERRGVSVTDLRFVSAGQKILTGAVPRYTEKKSLEEKLEEVSGVGSSTAERIADKDYIDSIEDLQELTVSELSDINRVGESTAENIKQRFEIGRFSKALFEEWEYEDNWRAPENPTVLRLDPHETKSERTVMGANILAAEAFPFFTVVPEEETQTVGIINDRSEEVVGYFRYPIWNKWMCEEEIKYILSHPELKSENPDTNRLKHIEEIYEAEKVCGDEDCHYKNFNPPHPV